MKKNIFLHFSIIAFAILFLAGCDTVITKNPEGELQNLSGFVVITPSANINTGTELTAVYIGTETVNYQWNRDGAAVPGATGSIYTPPVAGSYSVTISATGYNKKTSDAVTVIGDALPALTGTVSIIGYAEVGQILTANTNDLGGSGNISYQWKRGGTAIGANGSSYTVQSADIGSTITVTVTRSGNTGGVTSDPTAVVTAEATGTPGLAFSKISGNTAWSVSRGTATAAEVVIPALFEGLPVTNIADFSSYTNMTGVRIPDRVTSISSNAFSNCTGLTSVIIPKSVTAIGSNAFTNCTSLTSITIPFFGGTLKGKTCRYKTKDH